MKNILDKFQKVNYISTMDLDQTFNQNFSPRSRVPIYKGCSISPWLLERLCCYHKCVTTLREYHLILVRIQSFKSVRWLENFLQTVEFSFSLLKHNHGKSEFRQAQFTFVTDFLFLAYNNESTFYQHNVAKIPSNDVKKCPNIAQTQPHEPTFVIGCEQTRHPSCRQLPHAQTFM